MTGGDNSLREALSLMRGALALIDEADEAHDVGAHLDLAICKLDRLLADERADSQRKSGNGGN